MVTLFIILLITLSINMQQIIMILKLMTWLHLTPSPPKKNKIKTNLWCNNNKRRNFFRSCCSLNQGTSLCPAVFMYFKIFVEVCVWHLFWNTCNRSVFKRAIPLKCLMEGREDIYFYTIQSNLYIKATQWNLKMWAFWAVALYI